MYYGGNYNNFYQPNKKQKKDRSYISLVFVMFILLICTAVLTFLIIYAQSTEKYESKLAEYQNIVNDYKTEHENYEENINYLNEQIASLYDYTKNLENNLQKLSSLNNNLNNLNAQANISDLNISETAAKVSQSVIGIKVDVPSQNINSYWRTQPIEASGSGIILTEDGYIVTNYHVVSYAVAYKNAIITVVLNDDSEYNAKYIGGDEINDLAIIKITAKNLPYATLGSSDKSKVGDFVIAIGNPLGAYLSGSVTFGIISGVNRKIEAENVAEKLIQTDAAINPGNSGGALLNLNGEVIGINTVKISKSNVEGIGFAIPIDYAKPLIDSIIKYGYVKDRPTLGVSGTDITSSMARIYNIPRGLYIEKIEVDSGAAKAGIKTNDIITKIDGKTVYALNDIANLIKSHKVGDKVTVTIWRNGEYLELPVVLTEQK